MNIYLLDIDFFLSIMRRKIFVTYNYKK